ncbi:hypothetical protein [Sarcina ventriculi]|uniref:Lactococcin 972 family bacteriocin n=1 Tax=Sarcina ventriculi TaxID=1267 RepID=A0ABP2ASL6_SARVE|nr:hypothetical protein [Sarcina ventriculi]CUO25440.1 Uncharacterised protein [Sarcina ventriculi]
MKKIICSMLLLETIASTGIVANATNNVDKASGGWSESQGYYTDNIAKGSSPESHTGKRESQVYNSSGDVRARAVGTTVWKNTYHFTRARMEKTNGTVKTDSGRQYGTGGTTATSPWAYPGVLENLEARTYWGRG